MPLTAIPTFREPAMPAPRRALEAAAGHLAEAVAARHFERHPGALGVALGAGSRRLAAGARWLDGVETDAHWWRALALPVRGRPTPPMLLVDLDADRSAADRWSMWCDVADHAPDGSALLVRVADPGLMGALRDPSALRGRHRRLRLDAMHRPSMAAGKAVAAWGLALELLNGQPPMALCRLGIDP